MRESLPSRHGYNAWRCVEAGPVLLVWGDDAKLHAGARAENGSPRSCKRLRRACEALEARSQAGVDGPALSAMPAMDGGRHIEGARTVGYPQEPGPSRAQGLGDAEEPELHGTNHRTGHGDVSYRPAQAGH